VLPHCVQRDAHLALPAALYRLPVPAVRPALGGVANGVNIFLRQRAADGINLPATWRFPSISSISCLFPSPAVPRAPSLPSTSACKIPRLRALLYFICPLVSGLFLDLRTVCPVAAPPAGTRLSLAPAGAFYAATPLPLSHLYLLFVVHWKGDV